MTSSTITAHSTNSSSHLASALLLDSAVPLSSRKGPYYDAPFSPGKMHKSNLVDVCPVLNARAYNFKYCILYN